MSTVVTFQSSGVADLRALLTMGVSVKESDNPIGFFGTGFKYAVAVLLRYGHAVDLYLGTQRHEFGVARETIRGQDFDLVTLDGREVGFTTQLGRKWQLWMALRELYANTADEAGSSALGRMDPLPDYTTIVVRGREFADAFARLDEYFLSGEPLARSGPVEIHPGPSRHLFYRGVRVFDLEAPSVHKYNVITPVDLTEDRTMRYWHVDGASALARGLMQCDRADLVRDALLGGPERIESILPYATCVPGDTFLRVVGGLRHHKDLPKAALIAYQRATDDAEEAGEVELSASDATLLDAGIAICRRLGFDASRYRIRVAASLGEGTLGKARCDLGEIWLSRSCFLKGERIVAGTLLEECLHLEQGFGDCSREMQDFLIDLAVSLAPRDDGEYRQPARKYPGMEAAE